MSESVRVMYSEEQVAERIRELGDEITRDFAGQEIRLICMLKGAAPFACELAKRIKLPVYMDYMRVSSYGNETRSSGDVKINADLSMPVDGENVVIAEDIVDSGNTMSFVTDLLRKRGAKNVKICAMLSKPSRREVDVDIDYLGYEIPDEFVVGWGLDYAQKYRNLPFIGVVELDNE